MLKYLLGFLLIPHLSFAESGDATFSEKQSHIYGGLTFTSGGLGLGADYEYGYHQTYGIGGYVRLYSKDDDKPGGSGYGVNTFGGFIRPHFYRRAWDLYTSIGFGVATIDTADGRDDETAIGPSLGLGIFYQISDHFAVGAENMKLWGWFADDWRGGVMDEISIRCRYSF